MAHRESSSTPPKPPKGFSFNRHLISGTYTKTSLFVSLASLNIKTKTNKMTLTGYSKLLLRHRHIIDLCRYAYEFMKFPHKADMQSEEAPRGSSSTPPGDPRGFHKNFFMYICTKSSWFVSLTQAAAAHEN